MNDTGKLLDNDYEELMDWLERKLEPEEQEETEDVEEQEEEAEEVVESEGE